MTRLCLWLAAFYISLILLLLDLSGHLKLKLVGQICKFGLYLLLFQVKKRTFTNHFYKSFNVFPYYWQWKWFLWQLQASDNVSIGKSDFYLKIYFVPCVIWSLQLTVYSVILLFVKVFSISNTLVNIDSCLEQ